MSEEVAGEAVEDAAPEHHVSESLLAKVEQAEPVTAEEAEQIAPAQPVSAQPYLSADPSDYSVSADESIEVQAEETLGHFADWLGVTAWRLRRLNGMRHRQRGKGVSALELDRKTRADLIQIEFQDSDPFVGINCCIREWASRSANFCLCQYRDHDRLHKERPRADWPIRDLDVAGAVAAQCAMQEDDPSMLDILPKRPVAHLSDAVTRR